MRKLLSDLIFDLAKCPNRKTCIFTFMRFPIWALPKVQNWFWKHFSHKVVYNYCSNFYFFYVSVNIFKYNGKSIFLLFQILTKTQKTKLRTVRGCSHMTSAKNGGVQTPPPPPCQPKSEIGLPPLLLNYLHIRKVRKSKKIQV